MLQIAYFIGDFCVFFFALYILREGNQKYGGLTSKLLLITIGIIPFGKLIFFPIDGFTGLRLQFIFSSLISLLWFLSYGFNKKTLILFLPVLFSFFSLIFLRDYSDLWLHPYIEKAGVDEGGVTGTSESSLLRCFAYLFLIAYSASIYTFLVRNENGNNLLRYISRLYIYGLSLSCCIGVYIFYNVWMGSFSIQDLEPITPGTPHFIGNFYRFNPGANVNEFSMLLAFGIFLLPYAEFRKSYSIFILIFFLLCEFAGLTRSSWLGLLFGGAIGFFYYRPKSKFIFKIFFTAFFLLLIFLTLYFYVPEVKELIETRLAFDIGVSGTDRLDKFEYVYLGLQESFLRALFGFGWGSNLYVHNVYLQLISESGIFGLTIFLVSLAIFLRNVTKMNKGFKKFSLMGILIFIAISASMQHTFYHLQTWFMLAFVAAAAEIDHRSSDV